MGGWHRHQLFFSFNVLVFDGIDIILDMNFVTFLLLQSHDEKFILSLACLDLFLHELLLSKHGLYLLREHVHRVEVVFFHL